MSQPKILFLDHAGVLGGAELSLLTLAKSLREESSVLLFEDGPFRELLEREGVPVEVLKAPAWMSGVGRAGRGLAHLLAFPGLAIFAGRVAARARRFDVLFANSQKSLVVGSLAALLSRKPLVWCLHDIVDAEHFSAMNRRISVFFGNRFARRIITNSEASRDAFQAAGGRQDAVTVVYNGLDARPYELRTPEAAKKTRASLGLDSQPIVSLFSRIAPWKGQHILLEALLQLPGVHALVVGAPLFGDEQRYFEQLQAQVQSSGLDGRVHFLGFREDIPALLQASDIVVHTSVSAEPFGRVIVEGMLAGKPVVATKAGGACEIIEDGVTGRLVEPGNSTLLAGAIQELLADSEGTRRMAAAAEEAARERFPVGKMVREIRAEIDLALARPT